VKINEQAAMNIPKPQSGSLYNAPGPTRSSTSAPKSPLESTGDQIDLGSQSGLVSQIQNAGADARASRVQELRAAIQSGQYQTDTAALSQSVVNAMTNGY